MTGLLHVVEATVASADVPSSAAFCREVFDLDVLARHPGDAVVLGVAGSPAGRLRLVPATPGRPPFRPAVWDVGPRLLGIYSRSPHETVARVRAHGGEAGDPVSYPYGTGVLTEALARGPDGLWWTVPSALDGHRPSPALSADPLRTHSELHTAVLVVADHDAAVRFFVEGGGLLPLFDATMAGEPFERLTGMPAGADLRLSFLVGPGQAPARLELMSFRGVDAVDRQDAPLGLRRLAFAVADAGATRRSLLAAGAVAAGDGEVLRGPAGIEIELVEGAAP